LGGAEEQDSTEYMQPVCREWNHRVNDPVLWCVVILLTAAPPRRRAEEHKRKAEFIDGLIENWEESNRVRAFVKALTEAVSQRELFDDKEHEIQQVLDWTAKYADLLDPLTDLQSPNSRVQN
jgi:hypothetical protein